MLICGGLICGALNYRVRTSASHLKHWFTNYRRIMSNNKNKTKDELFQELVAAVEAQDRRVEATREYHSYKDYIKNYRFIDVRVPEYDKKMLKEINGKIMWKLRKQYSKNYQVVELEVSGESMEEFDNAVNWMDDKLAIELDAIPEELTKKEEKPAYGGKQNYQKKSKKQYNNKRNTYKKKSTGKDFGTEKQWKIVQDERNTEILAENGFDPDAIEDYNELKEAVACVFDNMNG